MADALAFVEEIRRRFRGNRERVFALYGNTGDLFPFEVAPGDVRLLTLPDYLYATLSARTTSDRPDRRIWIDCDAGRGIQWVGSDKVNGPARIRKLLDPDGPAGTLGSIVSMRQAREVVELVESVATRREESDDQFGIPLRVIIRDAHLSFPQAQIVFMRDEDREALALLKALAVDPRYDESDTLVLLIVESLSLLHEEIREVAVKIEVPRPDEAQIGRDLEREIGRLHVTHRDLPRLKRGAVGLRTRQAVNIVAECHHSGIELTAEILGVRRREANTRDFGELVTFKEPGWTLAEVGGNALALPAIRELADLFRRGDPSVPAGIVFTGPNGVGKTYVGEAFAGSLGLPFVELKSVLRSDLGGSERDEERVESMLRSAGQIVVGVDEAHATFGKTAGPNVHEVVKTICAMRLKLLSDKRYLGRIFWILMTSRPDQFAPDVTRPGRCDRMIPLFPETTPEGVAEIMRITVRSLGKIGFRFADDILGEAYATDTAIMDRLLGTTGGRIETVFKRAKWAAKDEPITLEHLRHAVVPKREAGRSDSEAWEFQRLIAIVTAIEASNEDLIPPFYLDELEAKYGGIDGAKRRIDALRVRVDQL